MLYLQGDHLSGKPGKPGNVREMSGISLKVREMSELSGKTSCHGKLLLWMALVFMMLSL